MKKLIGMIAIATLFSVVMMGCQPPVEGDTAPADPSKKTTADTKTATDSKTAIPNESAEPKTTG